MNLTILGFSHSPFCIAVEKALNAIGAAYVSKEVPAWDRREILTLTDGHAYEVPLLVHGEIPVYEKTADSQEIATYIDRHFASGRLFPNEFRGLHEVVIRYLENDVEDVTFRIFDPFFVDSIEDIAERGMLIRHKERKFGRGCVERWRREHEGLLDAAKRVLGPLNERLECTGAFLFGEAPVYADFLLGGILGNLTYSGYHSIPSGLEAMESFQARLEAYRYGVI